MNKKIKLIQDDCGVYHYFPVPSSEELQEYYANKYYQEARGSYSTTYTQEQLSWWYLRAELIAMQIEGLVDRFDNKSLLDIGCGEGWFLKSAAKRNARVRGFDFSCAGITKWNPDLLDRFVQGNIYTLLDETCSRSEKFDIIFIGNVIEHVLDPAELLKKITNILSSSGVLVIVAPNDFSDLQNVISERDIYREKKWWLAYPEHLSYFNKESMCKFLVKNGYELISTIGDFPIEFNLFTESMNYINDKSVGKFAHELRVSIDNYLFLNSPSVLLEIYRNLGSIGVGRNLIYFCKIKKQ